MTIVNDDCRVINKLEASLTDDARVVIYDRHMFIVQATDYTITKALGKDKHSSFFATLLVKKRKRKKFFSIETYKFEDEEILEDGFFLVFLDEQSLYHVRSDDQKLLKMFPFFTLKL
jgi:hypothetical protein